MDASVCRYKIIILVLIFFSLISVGYGGSTPSRVKHTYVGGRIQVEGKKLFFYAYLNATKDTLLIDQYVQSRGKQKYQKTKTYPLTNEWRVKHAQWKLNSLEIPFDLKQSIEIARVRCDWLYSPLPELPVEGLNREIQEIVSRFKAAEDEITYQDLSLFKIDGKLYQLRAIFDRKNNISSFVIVDKAGSRVPFKAEKFAGEIIFRNQKGEIAFRLENISAGSEKGGRYALHLKNKRKKGYTRFDFNLDAKIEKGEKEWIYSGYKKIDGDIDLTSDRVTQKESKAKRILMTPIRWIGRVADVLFGLSIWSILPTDTKELQEQLIIDTLKENEAAASILSDRQIREIAERAVQQKEIKRGATPVMHKSGDLAKRAAQIATHELIITALNDSLISLANPSDNAEYLHDLVLKSHNRRGLQEDSRENTYLECFSRYKDDAQKKCLVHFIGSLITENVEKLDDRTRDHIRKIKISLYLEKQLKSCLKEKQATKSGRMSCFNYMIATLSRYKHVKKNSPLGKLNLYVNEIYQEFSSCVKRTKGNQKEQKTCSLNLVRKMMKTNFPDNSYIKDPEKLAELTFQKYQSCRKKKSGKGCMRDLTIEFLQEHYPMIRRERLVNRSAALIVRDFNKCVKQVERPSELDKCTEAFARSAPHRVGAEIVSNILKVKLAQLGLHDQKVGKKSVLNEILESARDEYNKCSQSNYFLAYDRHEAKRKERKELGEFDSKTAIQACVFVGLMSGVKNAAKGIIITKLDESIGDNQALRKEASRVIRATVHQCKFESGLTIRGENYSRFPMSLLSAETVDSFQSKLETCLSKTTLAAGHFIIKGELYKNPAILEAVGDDPAALEKFADGILKDGYERCLAIQRKNGKEYPDPERCTGIIETMATGRAIALTLENSIAEETQDSPEVATRLMRELGLTQKAQDSFDVKECFERQEARMFANLGNESDLGLSDEHGNSLCLRQAVITMGPSLAAHIFQKTVETNQTLVDAGIKVTPALQSKVHSHIKSCFNSGLKGEHTITGLSEQIEKVKKGCTVSLLKKILPDLVEKVLDKKLETVVADKNKRKQLIAELVDRLIADISRQKTEEAIMAVLDNFSPRATLYVLERVVFDKVDESVPAGTWLNSRVKERIKQELLTPKFKAKLTAALLDKNSKRSERTSTGLLNQFKKDAALIIMDAAIPYKIGKLFKDENKQSVNKIKLGALKSFRSCIARISNYSKSFDDRFDLCANQTVDKTTYDVMSTLLGFTLKEMFPSNDATRSILRAKLLGYSLKKKIAKANRSKDSKASDRLADEFKRDSAIAIAEMMIFQKVEDAVGLHEVAAKITDYHAMPRLRNCFAIRIDQRGMSVDDAIKVCSQSATVLTSEKVLEHMLAENIGLLEEDKKLSSRLLSRAATDLKSCTGKIKYGIEDEVFTRRLDDCIGDTVLRFTKTIGLETLKFLRPVRDHYLAEGPFRQCIDHAIHAYKADRPRHDVDWAQVQVEKCANQVLKSKLVLELAKTFVSRSDKQHDSKLYRGEKVVLENVFQWIVTPVLKLNLQDTKSKKSTKGSIRDTLNTILDMASLFAGMGVQFDQVDLQKRGYELAMQLKKKEKELNGRPLEQEDLIRIIVNSRLFDLLMMGTIHHYWNNGKAKGLLSLGGLPGILIGRVANTPEKIKDIFERDPRGRYVLHKIKYEIIEPVLKGKGVGEVAKDLGGKVSRALMRYARNLVAR